MPPRLTHVLEKTEINTHSRQGQLAQGQLEGRAQSLDSFANSVPNFTESEPPRHLWPWTAKMLARQR